MYLGTTCRTVCPGPTNCVYCVLSVQSMVSYVHRIGRTGRAGKAGEAITLYTEQDMVRPDKSRCSGPAMWIFIRIPTAPPPPTSHTHAFTHYTWSSPRWTHHVLVESTPHAANGSHFVRVTCCTYCLCGCI